MLSRLSLHHSSVSAWFMQRAVHNNAIHARTIAITTSTMPISHPLREMNRLFFSSSSSVSASVSSNSSTNKPNTISVLFIDADGDKELIKDAGIGESILDVAHDNDIEIEGACGGECACSTCHVILDKDIYDKLSKPSEEEEDMLDLAIGLTKTSRLGCQVKLTKDMNGMTIRLPKEVQNLQSKSD